MLYAEPDYISKLSEADPEPNYAELYGDITNTQWGFHNDGTIMNTQNPTLKDFALNPTDWNNPEKENATGVIAFIDSGINYDHPDLKNIIVDNMDEYNPIGGKYGYAPCKEDVTDPMDDNGHGTHCAGIAAAEWNDFGVSGAASGCKVTAVKAGTADGYLKDSDVIKGYQYLSTVIDNGLEIIAVSNSWGANIGTCAQALNLCITEVGRKGAISIFAAGNDSSDCDIVYDTTASISMNPYVVTVGASSPYGDSAAFSNYGETSVDIFAPGVGIMSTYYNNDEEYVFETDKSPLLTEDFSDKNSDIDFIGKDGKPINYWFDEKINFDGNSSLAFKLSDCEEIIKEETGEVRKVFKIFVPIDKEDAKDLNFINYAIHYSFPDSGVITSAVTLDAEGNEEDTRLFGWYLQKSWNSFSANIAKILGDAGRTLKLDEADENTVIMQINCLVASGGNPLPDDGIVYIDDFTLGKNNAPFVYLNGTSMATPAVSGCAAIVAKEQRENGAELFGDKKSELAIERANILKGRVTHYDTLDENLCRQGGQLDMSITDVSEYTPVINYAEFDDEFVDIKGAFFGDYGSVTINGVEADYDLWSDNEIFAIMPSGIDSGKVKITVTSAKEKTGKNAFLFEAKDDKCLYEKILPLPSVEGIADCISSFDNRLTALNGKLYVPFTSNADDDFTKKLYCYNIAENKWDEPVDLLIDLYKPSCAAYRGRIYVYGVIVLIKDNDTMVQGTALFEYNPESKKWKYWAFEDLPAYASLANANGTMLLIGGEEYDEETKEYVLAKENNIIKLDINGDICDVESVGTLSVPQEASYIGVNGNDVYVFNNVYTDGEKAFDKITVTDEGVNVQDLSDKIPVQYSGYSDYFSMTAAKEGLVFTGLYQDSGDGTPADYDTYIFRYDDETLVPFEKRVYPDIIDCSASYAYNGYLYVFAMTRFEDNAIIGRAAAMETNKLAGDGEVRPEFTGAGITLTSEISINMYFDIKPSQIEKTKIYINGESEPITPVYDESEKIYKYEVKAAPKDAYNSIKHVKITYDDGIAYDCDYSLKENYIDIILNDKSGMFDSYKEIVSAVDAYIRAAEIYFDKSKSFDDEITGEIETAFETSKNSLETVKDFVYNDVNEDISYVGSSLILEKDVTLRHYFKVKDYEAIKDKLFDANGNKAELVSKDGMYYFDTCGFLPNTYDNTTALKYGEEVIVGDYSVLSYIKLTVSNSNKIGTICKAMCNYYYAAEKLLSKK